MAITVLAASGFVGGAYVGSVEAQSEGKAPVILIVNRARLIGESKAGKTIPEQAEKVKGTVEKELKAEADKLKTDIEKFQKNASLMSEEVRQKTQQELAVRQQVGLPQQAKIMEQALTAVLQNARDEVLVESRPILKEIVEKRGATILLDRSAVMYASPETDITDEVLQKLDKKLKKVEVEKITLASVKERIAEAQKANAAQQSKK